MIPREWLVHVTSLHRAEPLIEPKDHGHIGYLYLNHEEWERFKNNMEQGDELWEFRSPPETWETGGLEGYAIVRAGEPIDTILFTRMW